MTAANLASLRDSAGLRLTLGLIDLSAYRTSAIPQSFLDTLTAKFALLRSNGMKVIVRAVYNYDSSGSDASVTQLKAHLTQLAPVFAANVDVIAYFQGGFIGAWGEWHDSASGLASDANKAAVRDALLAAVPAQMPVQFRYPTDVIKWYPTALSAMKALFPPAPSGMSNVCPVPDNWRKPVFILKRCWAMPITWDYIPNSWVLKDSIWATSPRPLHTSASSARHIT